MTARLTRRLAKATPERLRRLLRDDEVHRRRLMVEGYRLRVALEQGPQVPLDVREVARILAGTSSGTAPPGWADPLEAIREVVEGRPTPFRRRAA